MKIEKLLKVATYKHIYFYAYNNDNDVRSLTKHTVQAALYFLLQVQHQFYVGSITAHKLYLKQHWLQGGKTTVLHIQMQFSSSIINTPWKQHRAGQERPTERISIVTVCSVWGWDLCFIPFFLTDFVSVKHIQLYLAHVDSLFTTSDKFHCNGRMDQ